VVQNQGEKRAYQRRDELFDITCAWPRSRGPSGRRSSPTRINPTGGPELARPYLCDRRYTAENWRAVRSGGGCAWGGSSPSPRLTPACSPPPCVRSSRDSAPPGKAHSWAFCASAPRPPAHSPCWSRFALRSKLTRAPGTIPPTHPAPTTGHAGDSHRSSPAQLGSAVAAFNDSGHLPPPATAG